MPVSFSSTKKASEQTEARPPTGAGLVEFESPGGRKRRVSPLAIAWMVTLCEALLWSGMLWVFSQYWLMLPVRYRVAGVLGLFTLGAIGVFRIAAFHRRIARADRGSDTDDSSGAERKD